MSFQKKLIRLAFEKPELRPHLLPILKEAALSLRDVEAMVSTVREQTEDIEGSLDMIKLVCDRPLQSYVREPGEVGRQAKIVQQKLQALSGFMDALKSLQEEVDELYGDVYPLTEYGQKFGPPKFQ